jgi:hypothetical protein
MFLIITVVMTSSWFFLANLPKRPFAKLDAVGAVEEETFDACVDNEEETSVEIVKSLAIEAFRSSRFKNGVD